MDITGKLLFAKKLQDQRKISKFDNINQVHLCFMSINTLSEVSTKNV
jgi:hypothetical protein